MSRSDLERLQDACDFARHAKNNASGLDADILADAIQPQHAALFDLVIIGEALNNVSPEIQKAAPNARGDRSLICAISPFIRIGRSILKSSPMSSTTGSTRLLKNLTET
jgi:hypothetical protein